MLASFSSKQKLAECDVAHRLLTRVLAMEHLSEMATTYSDIGLNSVKRAIMTGHWSGSEKLKQLKSQPWSWIIQTQPLPTYNNIREVLFYKGDYDGSIVWYEKALVIRESVLGKDYPDTVTAYNNITCTSCEG
jgi:tetratricopeptide (TPR) repeat protein